MRKIFKKLAFFFVAILSLTVSSSYSVKEVNAADEEKYSYTFTSTQFSANGKKTLGGVEWTLAGNGNYWGYDNTKGQQFGSGNAPYKSMTLSTSSIEGEITSIEINTSGASSISGSLQITVGGENFGNKITLTKTATKYTANGASSGEIKLNYTQTSSKAIYIKSISVTYNTSGSTEPETPKYSIDIEDNPIELYFESSYQIKINNLNPMDVKINWSSSNEEVATVSSDGLVTAKTTIGSTTIKAELADKNTIYDEVVVNVNEKPFYKYTFEEKKYDSNGTVKLDNYYWTLSGDGNYWDNEGTKGHQFGSGSDPYKKLSLKCETSFSNIKSIIINTSGAKDIAATLNVTLDDIQVDSNITLTSDATEYAIECDNKSGQISFNYTQSSSKAIYIKSIEIYCDGVLTPTISLDKDNLLLIEGDTDKVNVTTENPSNAKVKWYSNDENIATVDEEGNVTGVSYGSTTIDAKLFVDESISKSVTVNVYRNPDVDLDNDNPTYNISEYMPGVDGASNEVHKFDNNTSITTNNCYFGSELTIYSSINGEVILNSTKNIVGLTLEAYVIKDEGGNTPASAFKIYGINADNSEELIKNQSLNSTSEIYNFEFDSKPTKSLRIDTTGGNINVKSLSLTLVEDAPIEVNPISDFETNASLSFDYSYTKNIETITNETKYWGKVNDASTLAAGDKVVVVAAGYNFALSKTQNNNNRAQAAITKSRDTNTITIGNDVQILTLEAGTKDNTFSFNTGSGYLYAASSSSNHLKTQTTKNDNGSWSITISSDGVATIKAQGTNSRNWMRYNSTNNPPIFSCYGSGQADISLYKEFTTPGENVEVTNYTNQEFSNVKIGFSASVDVSEFGDKTISKAGVIFTHTENEEKEASKTIYSAINTNKEDALYQFLTSNSEDYRYIEKTYTVDNPLKSNDNKYSVFGSMSVINGEVTDTNISRLSKTVTAAVYFVVDGEVIILQDKTYSVKGMLNEYSTNSALTEQQKEAVNVFKSYIEENNA